MFATPMGRPAWTNRCFLRFEGQSNQRRNSKIKTKSSNERIIKICQNWMQLVQERQRHRSLSSHPRFLLGAQGNPCLDMGSVAVLIPTVHEDRGLCHLSCHMAGTFPYHQLNISVSRFKNVSWQVSNLITYSPAQESTLPLPLML